MPNLKDFLGVLLTCAAPFILTFGLLDLAAKISSLFDKNKQDNQPK